MDLLLLALWTFVHRPLFPWRLVAPPTDYAHPRPRVVFEATAEGGMGLFGFNVVLTMIVASVIHKLGPHYSFGRWFLTRGLHYYTVPVDSTLISHLATQLRNFKKDTQVLAPGLWSLLKKDRSHTIDPNANKLCCHSHLLLQGVQVDTGSVHGRPFRDVCYILSLFLQSGLALLTSQYE